MLLVKEIALITTREEARLNARLFARSFTRLRLLEAVVAIVFARDFTRVVEFERVALIALERAITLPRVTLELKVADIVCPTEYILVRVSVEAWLTEITTDWDRPLAWVTRLLRVALRVLPISLSRVTAEELLIALVTAIANILVIAVVRTIARARAIPLPKLRLLGLLAEIVWS